METAEQYPFALLTSINAPRSGTEGTMVNALGDVQRIQ